jgi:hypothetical protein
MVKTLKTSFKIQAGIKILFHAKQIYNTFSKIASPTLCNKDQLHLISSSTIVLWLCWYTEKLKGISHLLQAIIKIYNTFSKIASPTLCIKDQLHFISSSTTLLWLCWYTEKLKSITHLLQAIIIIIYPWILSLQSPRIWCSITIALRWRCIVLVCRMFLTWLSIWWLGIAVMTPWMWTRRIAWSCTCGEYPSH